MAGHRDQAWGETRAGLLARLLPSPRHADVWTPLQYVQFRQFASCHAGQAQQSNSSRVRSKTCVWFIACCEGPDMLPCRSTCMTANLGVLSLLGHK